MSDVYLWDTYQQVGREALERRDYEQAVESFRAAVSLAEDLPGEDPRLVVSLRHLSQATSRQGQVSYAYDLLRRTLEVSIAKLGESSSETVQVQRELFEAARHLGYLDQAEEYLTAVLGAAKEQGDTLEFLEILEQLAQLATERERPGDAATIYQEILDARISLYGEDHPSVAQALLWLSTALSNSGQGKLAEEPLERGLGLLEAQFADDPQSLAQSLLAGAELMTQSGQLSAALEHQKRALDILNTIHDEEHQSVWDARELIASSLAGLGQLEEAIELLEFCARHRKAQDHRTGGILKNLGGLYLSIGKIDRAEELYNEAADLFHETLGSDHPFSLATTEERIQLYHFTGRPQKALDLALTTIRATEERYGAGHPNTAQAYASTAVLAHASRNWETSYQLMKAAEGIWETLIPRPLDVLANCRVNLATCLVELGRNDEAEAMLDKVQAPTGSPLAMVVGDLRARLKLAAGAILVETDRGDASQAAIEEESPNVRLEGPTQDAFRLELEALSQGAEDEDEDEDVPTLAEPDSLTDDDPSIAFIAYQDTALADPSEEGALSATPSSAFDPQGLPELQPDLPSVDAEDRRGHDRFNLGLNRFLELSLLDEAGELFVVRSFLVDLSLGGLRVNSERPLPLETTFLLTLPSQILGDNLSVRARVVWQRELFGATFIQGVEFLDLGSEEKRRIGGVLSAGDLSSGGRQHFRLYRPFPIQLHHGDKETDWLSSYASDLSLEGVGTRLGIALEAGERVRLRLTPEFELPTVEVAATVAWSRAGDNGVSHGLKFDDVGPVESKTIKLYIDRCLELSPDENL